MTEVLERKTPEQLEKMRAAGLVVARTLELLRKSAVAGVSTAELDQIASENIKSEGAKPSFLGYNGYPATICTSVNEQIVHGIPSKNLILRDGDTISIDCGAIVDGWHGDSAITVLIGDVRPEVSKLAKVCADAMWAGIEQMRPGNRLTDVSHAIAKSIRNAGRYGIVREYGGHGIGTEMHMDPHVLNYGRPNRGPVLKPGVTLAIEPMVTLGSASVKVLPDDWTVVTKDNSWSAHTEHTVAVTDGAPRILTALD
ncbi:MAG: type I methionyl aminopeptidase [Corynebacteriales bacterium]|nr:type I methionyl aminopeptidase [Mycobacteriales bacterium]